MYAKRREEFFKQMLPNSIAILAASPACTRNNGVVFPYRQHSDMLYLTGFAEQDSVAVFEKTDLGNRFVLFCLEHDPKIEQWIGSRSGQKDAIKNFQADKAHSIDELDQYMPEMLQNKQCVYYAYGRDAEFDHHFFDWFNQVRSLSRSMVSAPSQIINIESILHEMRLIKSKEEIDLIQHAVDINVGAFKRIMQSCKPGIHEYELAADLHYFYQKNGAHELAFPTIVGSGENATILHYDKAQSVLKDGDLVLIDAGCKFQNYSSDITRTIPVKGKFSKEQRAIYDLVLKMQLAGLKKFRPGTSCHDAHKAAVCVATEGLCKLGLLQGDIDNLIEQGAYKTFYMHNFSHWIGLDVHDPCAYAINGQWRKLQPGMVLSAEPGIYIKPGLKGVDKKWWNIGVRIEDDILITENGHDVLTKALPKEAEEIEKISSNFLKKACKEAKFKFK